MTTKELKKRMDRGYPVYEGIGRLLTHLAVLCSCLALVLSAAVPLSVSYPDSNQHLYNGFEASIADMANSYPANAMWIEPSILNVSYLEFANGFNVTVWANVDQSSTTWQIALRFDPTYLNITGFGLTGPTGRTSDFFSGGYPTVNSGTIYIDNGVAYYFEIISGAGTRPAGSGSLCWIEFQGITVANETTLNLEPADSFVLDSTLNEIPMAYHGTQIRVSLIGDINGDGKVDMKDIAYVARRFMCTPSDPLWDPAADINSDGIINMIDIATVARHFTEHYP
jgi:hypothetical protein